MSELDERKGIADTVLEAAMIMDGLMKPEDAIEKIETNHTARQVTVTLESGVVHLIGVKP